MNELYPESCLLSDFKFKKGHPIIVSDVEEKSQKGSKRCFTKDFRERAKKIVKKSKSKPKPNVTIFKQYLKFKLKQFLVDPPQSYVRIGITSGITN